VSNTKQVVCPYCNKLSRLSIAKDADEGHCGACHKRLFTGKAIKVDDDGLKRHIQKDDLPVLVDFWAPWCAPCKMMAPVFEQLASEVEPRVRFLKLNTEDYPSAAAPLGIRSIPTLILFKRGRELARVSGAMDKSGLSNWLQQQNI